MHSAMREAETEFPVDKQVQTPRPYPFGAAPLKPAITDAKAIGFAIATTMAMAICIWKRAPQELAAFDDLALKVIFPALLAAVLSLAPRPAHRLGQIAKDLTVIALIGAMLIGTAFPVMIASFPLVLAVSALVNRWSKSRLLWPHAL